MLSILPIRRRTREEIERDRKQFLEHMKHSDDVLLFYYLDKGWSLEGARWVIKTLREWETST